MLHAEAQAKLEILRILAQGDASTTVKVLVQANIVVDKVTIKPPAPKVVTERYVRPSGATTSAQRTTVQGRPCVDCNTVTNKQVAGHKYPLVKEYYETGTIDLTKMRSIAAVQPQ